MTLFYPFGAWANTELEGLIDFQKISLQKPPCETLARIEQRAQETDDPLVFRGWETLYRGHLDACPKRTEVIRQLYFTRFISERKTEYMLKATLQLDSTDHVQLTGPDSRSRDLKFRAIPQRQWTAELNQNAPGLYRLQAGGGRWNESFLFCWDGLQGLDARVLPSAAHGWELRLNIHPSLCRQSGEDAVLSVALLPLSQNVQPVWDAIRPVNGMSMTLSIPENVHRLFHRDILELHISYIETYRVAGIEFVRETRQIQPFTFPH